MKVLKQGKVGNQWSLEHECTGWGNGGNGCNALLLVEYSDLRYFPANDSPSWGSNDAAVCFKCPCCGKITDLGLNDWPSGAKTLPLFTSAWKDAPPKNVVSEETYR